MSGAKQTLLRRGSDDADRRPFTFVLDGHLVEKARTEVGESDMVRSIEAALVAALDYNMWVREVTNGGDPVD